MSKEKKVPDIIYDPEMNTDVYLFDQKRNGDEISVHRGKFDRAAGVKVEWRVTGEISSDNQLTVKESSYESESASDVPDSWKGGKVLKDHFGKVAYDVSYEERGNEIIETSTTPRTSMGVTSYYQRIWDINDNTVRLYSGEGQYVSDGKGGETYNQYLDVHEGTFDATGNAYLAELRQKLAI